MTNQERAEMLVRVLKPCLKKSHHEDWLTYRYNTEWGTKTEQGLVNTIVRIMTDAQFDGSL